MVTFINFIAKLHPLILWLSVASLCSAYCQEAPRQRQAPALDKSESRTAEIKIKRKRSLLPGKTPGAIPSTWIVTGEPRDSGFGESVAARGDVNGDGFDDVLIGAPKAAGGRGKVFIYLGSTGGLPTSPTAVLEGSASAKEFGAVGAFAGDVNHDGFHDVLVRTGIPGAAEPEAESAYLLFYGSASGLSNSPAWTFGHQIGKYDHLLLGAGVGDLNGDGCADFAIRALERNPDNPALHRQVVLVFYGSPSGPKSAPDLVLQSEYPASMFGFSIAGAGDVNGDDYDDLIIGANGFGGRYEQGGKAYVYYGSKNGIRTTPDWTAIYNLPVLPGIDDASLQEFGYSVSSAGDVNGDGFGDVIIGAPFAERGDRDEGLAFVFLGSATGLKTNSAAILESNHAYALLGWSVSGAGDVNGDGFDDVIAGAPQAAPSQINEGAALVFYGSSSGPHTALDWSRLNDGANEFFGHFVTGTGDVNGDGFADVLIAAPDYGINGVKHGRVRVEYGSPTGLRNSSEWSLTKPWLTATQQQLHQIQMRVGTVIYWGPPLLGFAILSSALLYVQHRQRRRITALLAENRELTLVRERTRIARDIHDHLGVDLTRLSIRAEEAQKNIGQPTESADHLAEISNSARRVVDTISELVWATDPAHDTLESFINYLAEFAQELLTTNKIGCDLDLPVERVEGRLSAALRHNLFLIVKEVLHNIVRHAHATRVTVTLRIDAGQLRLVIRDNGVGFNAPAWLRANGTPPEPPSGIAGARHRGLRNLATRVQEMHGMLTIDSTRASGTQVTITAPWREAVPN